MVNIMNWLKTLCCYPVRKISTRYVSSGGLVEYCLFFNIRSSGFTYGLSIFSTLRITPFGEHRVKNGKNSGQHGYRMKHDNESCFMHILRSDILNQCIKQGEGVEPALLHKQWSQKWKRHVPFFRWFPNWALMVKCSVLLLGLIIQWPCNRNRLIGGTYHI